jgi:hypothetical protein
MEVDRMLSQIQSFEDLAKNAVDPRVVGIFYIQKFADLFWFNNVSLKIRLPNVRKGFERTRRTILVPWLAG